MVGFFLRKLEDKMLRSELNENFWLFGLTNCFIFYGAISKANNNEVFAPGVFLVFLMAQVSEEEVMHILLTYHAF